MELAWMAWTPATAAFFAGLALLLATMTVLALKRPEAERVGILRMPTARGDRLFISLVLAAIVHLAWIGIAGVNTLAVLPVGGGVEISSLWLATALSFVIAIGILRVV